MLKFAKRLIASILILAVAAGGFITFLGYREYKAVTEQLSISAAAGQIRAKENYTLLSELPETYVKAVVAVEDKRFYRHFGIDPIGIGRAVYVNIRDKELHEGGSTITQQLAKNKYFIKKRSIVDKVAEAFTAVDLEKNFSKSEILELYVNNIYFGDGYYCVHDASEGYFKKPPSEMSYYECTMLAGIPNAPSVYAPTKNPDLAEQRRQVVVRRLKNK